MLLHVVFVFCLNMVFNGGMTDQELILKHGGPSAVAKLLGYDEKRGGTQRVQNWMTRGIPAQVKVDHPELFMPGLVPADSAPAQGAVQ
ncbi:hypothetical protein [Herbaspirillum seropedicae]|uniref:hypothetical protein n=1 Tax=Herbaspirillum seropedicae TaxID=964 RepID=UPI002861ACA0|nr:hypothetical protein [Herbaspirillum seropedicae]MDR6394654.1 hypothetical protein [Herbaspirillum seropedicae]